MEDIRQRISGIVSASRYYMQYGILYHESTCSPNRKRRVDKPLNRKYWLFALVLLISFAYSNSLQNSWHFDDYHSIVYNKSIRSIRNIRLFFSDPHAFTGMSASAKVMYRPLLLVGYALTYEIAGLYLPVWHLVQIALHVFCALCVYQLVLMLDGRFYVAFLATAMWALHPVHTHPVNYICSRSELQASLFYLLAMIAAMKDRRSIASFFFISGLLTKSIVVTFPAVMLLWESLLGPRRSEGLKNIARANASYWAILAIYLVLRKLLLGSVTIPEQLSGGSLGLRIVSDNAMPTAMHSWEGRSLLTNFLVQTKVFWLYLKLYFVPTSVCAAHDVTMDTSIAALAALFLLLASALLLSRSDPASSFAVGCYCILLAPTSLLPLNLLVNEHRVYLASTMFFWPAARALLGLADRVRAARAPVLCVSAALPLLFGFLTHQRNCFWRDDVTLFHDALLRAPKARYIGVHLGAALYRQGDISGALWYLEKSVKNYPSGEPLLWAFIADLHVQAHNYILARRYYCEAQKLWKPGSLAESYGCLGIFRFLVAVGELDKARRQLGILEELGYDHGRVEQLRIKLDNACKQLESRLSNCSDVIDRIGILIRLGRRGRAHILISQAKSMGLSKDHSRVLSFIEGNLLIQEGRYRQAVDPLEHTGVIGIERLLVALGGAGRQTDARDLAIKYRHQLGNLSYEARYFAGLPPYGPAVDGWTDEAP